MLTLCFCKVSEALITRLTRTQLVREARLKMVSLITIFLSGDTLGGPPLAGCLLGAGWWTSDWLPSNSIPDCLWTPELLSKQQVSSNHLQRILPLFCHSPLHSQSSHHAGDLRIHRPDSGYARKSRCYHIQVSTNSLLIPVSSNLTLLALEKSGCIPALFLKVGGVAGGGMGQI